jgi:beta-1,4-galactosyltransferase 1
MLKKGGQSAPNKCLSRHRVAIIVPYRNREMNLMIFLRHMHPFLMKQNIDYGIYIIEPLKEFTFNRGLLMNIGYLESLKQSNDKWQCFMFHGINIITITSSVIIITFVIFIILDVDLIPEDERNIYSCPETPRHVLILI